jgi:hypothetical protein
MVRRLQLIGTSLLLPRVALPVENKQVRTRRDNQIRKKLSGPFNSQDAF